MTLRRFLRAVLALAMVVSAGFRAMAQGPWVEPDLDAEVNKLLGSPPQQWRIVGAWKGGSETIQIVPGAKVICVGSDQIIFHGNHDWKGAYDEGSGELKVSRTLSAAEVQAIETRNQAPDWAKAMTAGKAVHEDMLLTVTVDPSGNLSMAGAVYGEKLDWEERVDESTGQPVPGTRKARVVADPDSRQPLGSAFTKEGISAEARARLKQELHLMLLFQHRDDLLNSDVPKQIAALEKSYEALKSSTGADEQRRLEEIGRSIDSLRTGWQREIAQNQSEILESALAHSSYYNPEVQDILGKYAQVKQARAAEPDNTLYPKILDDTATRLLLYLGRGADAMYAHDDDEKRAFLYSMIRAQSDFAHGTAVSASSMAIAGACPEAPPVRTSPRPSAIDAGVKWGKGIQEQGMPWEDYLAKQRPASSRLPPNFKTFDFYDEHTGVATSAKTLDTTSAGKIADPTQVYYSIKGNIDSAIDFETYELGGRMLKASDITSREVQLAVPEQTTPEQWQQINRAIDYGNLNGVRVVVTPVK